MRLTLRTLLAYLDDILEQDDTAIIKGKVEESAIATALITRIRDSVDRREVGALSPDVIGPLENANVMGEYLDSTLPPEQIAEIERLCLESDASLSEAAACHQILTVVLGQPARVSDALKKRIYDLPFSDDLLAMEQQTQPAADVRAAKPSSLATAPVVSHSALEIPEPAADDERNLGGGNTGVSNPDGVPSVAGVSAAEPSDWQSDAPTSIRPVGPDDSGVSHTAVRLKNAPDLDDESGRSEAEIVAGATRAMLDQTDGYRGSIRPSRIAPWLITLAMAAVVLYVLGQIFAPLQKRDVERVASTEIDDAMPTILEPVIEENELSSANEPPSVATPNVATPNDATPNVATPGSPTLDVAPPESGTPPPPADDLSPTVNADLQSDETETVAEVEMGSGLTPETDPIMPRPSNDSAATESSTGDPSTKAQDNTEPSVDTPDAEAMDNEPALAETNEDVSGDGNKTPAMEIPAMETPDSSGTMVAELTQPNGFVIVREQENWSRLLPRKADDAPAEPIKPNQPGNPVFGISVGQTVIAPAYFRPILADQSGLEWTLAGPTRMKLGVDPELGSVTQLVDGNILLASTQPDVTAAIIFGRRHVKVAMAEAQTVLAVELTHLRTPGLNPLAAENRLPVFRIISIQGTALLQSGLIDDGVISQTGDTVTLATGQQFQGRGIQPTVVGEIDRLPPWIDAPAKQGGLLESARDGLMEFVTKDEPIEKSLREAMAFRRVEVAALAAETLLLLGRADVYFGTDGILNRSRQRQYWEEHFQMLRQQIASDAEAANLIRLAIERAELADSQILFKLLVGFSTEELEAGGDEKLVSFLDSASMAVRVLAIENLRMIVGDSLGYRADQENANARKNDIKKWETRIRRGDIRYIE